MRNTSAVYKEKNTFSLENSEVPYPEPEEVTIEVAYCGICGTDRHVFHGTMDERVGPDAVIGHEMSGVIRKVGHNVSDFKPGDHVVVRPLDWCGECPTCRRGHIHICENLNFIGVDSEGAFQKFWNVDQRILHRIPDDISLKNAALAEPLSVAAHDVRRAGMEEDDFALIIGGGPIGILIALVLRYHKRKFILSEINTSRLTMAESIGIETVNPMEENLEIAIRARNRGCLADVVFEVSASAPGAIEMSRLTRPRGKIVLVGIFGKNPEICLKDFFFKELELYGARVYERRDFEESLQLLAQKDFPFDTVISRVYDLVDIEKAFRSLDEDLSAMKILIRCSEEILE